MNSLSVSLVSQQNNNYKTFTSKNTDTVPQNVSDGNPISRKGEAINLVKATFLGGIVLAGKLFWELIEDGDFEFDRVAKKASDLVEKNKKEASKNKKMLYKIGAFASLIGAAFAGFALLYTAFKAPNIVYNSKINTYTKNKEMDVYIKSNDAEKELYTQLAEKAEQSNDDEKENLKEQYLKMTKAKNQVPDFVKLKK